MTFSNIIPCEKNCIFSLQINYLYSLDNFVIIVLFYFIFFLIFLFIYDSYREREAETQAEGEAGSMHREPDVGFDPGSPGSCPGPKAGAKPLHHPGIPTQFLSEIKYGLFDILLSKFLCYFLNAFTI